MKRTLFWIVLIAINVLVIGGIIFWFTSNFGIIVYPKHKVSDFTQMERSTRISSVDALPFVTDDQRETADIGETLELRLRHPYCGFKTQPGVSGTGTFSKIPTTFTINAYGHRSPMLGAKPEGTLRIAMLGGSVVWLGTTNETAIVGELARILTENGYTSEFINAGIVSAVSSQELSVLVHELVDMDVDLVVSLNGFNDIYVPMHYNARPGWPFNDFTYYPQVPPLQSMSAEELEPYIAHYLHTIEKTALICQAHDIKYLAALQPAQEFAKHLESFSSKASVSPLINFYLTIIREFERMDTDIVNGGHYASVTGLIDSDDFVDEVHFHSEGNARIAQRLFEIIIQKQILTP